MEKMFFKDNQKMPIFDSTIIMTNLSASVEDSDNSRDNLEKMRKIFVDCYTNLGNLSQPDLSLEIARRYKEAGIAVNEEKLRLECVQNAIMEVNVEKRFSHEQLRMLDELEKFVLNTYVLDFLYEYFEGNLKKTIVSELFKRVFLITNNLYIVIRVSDERIEKIFENQTIKEKEMFFCQQLHTWFIYNKMDTFVKTEITSRDDKSGIKDVIIGIDFLSKIMNSYFNKK